MSPAAVDVRSPPTQNPSSMPQSNPGSSFNFGAVCSGFGDASGHGSDRDVSDFARSGPAVQPVRSRPRFVKVRRQTGSQHARSRTGSSEVGSGFNPFCSSNGVSTVSSSDNGNVSFVFGANNSGFSEGLDSRGSGRESSSDETGRSNVGKGMEFEKNENVGFVFGAKENGFGTKFSGKMEQSVANGEEGVFVDKGNTKTEPESECGKFGAGFAFGSNLIGMGSNLNPEKRESCEFAKNLNSDDSGKLKIETGAECMKDGKVTFVFGANPNGLVSDLKSEKGNAHFRRSFGQSGCSMGSNVKIGHETEDRKSSCPGFVFGASWCNSELNLNPEKRESCEFAKNSNSDDCGKVKLETAAECAWHGNVAFVFRANPNGLFSNLKSEKGNADFSSNIGLSGCCSGSNVKIGHETEDKKPSSSDFVFGASWCNSESNLSSEKRDSGENIEKRVPNRVEGGPEFQKANISGNWNLGNDSGVFVFGSSSRTSSCMNEGATAKCGDEVKLNNESLGNFNSTVEAKVNNLGQCKCPYDSSSSTTSAHKLHDEMKKLNIDDYVNVSCAENTEISNTKPYFKAEIASKSRRYIKVSRGFSKVSNSSSRNIETNSCDMSSKGPSVDVEITNASSPGRSEESHAFVNGSTEDDTSGISNSEPFTFKAGVGESVNVGQFHKSKAVDDTEANVASSQPLLSSNHHEFQPSLSEAAFVGVEKQNTQNSPSTSDGLGVSSDEFKTPICDPSSLKESLFSELNKKMEFSVKNRSIKDKRFWETKHKLKKPSVKHRLARDHASKESSSQENPNSPGCYSPMDFSPYQETTVTDQQSRETSATSDGSFHLDTNCRTCSPDAPVPADLKEEHMGIAKKGLDNDRGDQESKELSEENFGCHIEKSFIQNCPSISKAEFACSSGQMEQADDHSGAGVASVESIENFSSDMEKQDNISRMQFNFTSGLEDVKGKSFMFSASSAGQERLSARKHTHRRKSRIGVGRDSSVVTPSSNQSSTDAAGKFEASNQGHSYSSAEIHETCEKWRLRGNLSYEKGDLSKAEEFYTQGIISVPSSERSGSCLKPLLLCYSNRAAARMYLLRTREAIGDCMMAAALDPNFLKAQIRAANCHLVLGEIENALQLFNKCLETVVCLDRRIILDAADGQRKAQKVAEHMDRSSKLLEQRNPDAVLSALEFISEALSISLYSEKLLKMKAEALIMLRRHEEAIQLCEQSLSFAEKNFSSWNPSIQVEGFASEHHSFVRLWRWCLVSKSYFYLGRLEAALPLLDKLKQIGSIKDESARKDLESSASLAVTIRDLLHHKNAGNEAFKSGKYSEAVDHYTVALSSNVESRRFAAVCFCNRAAAHQALGQISDAIADCSVAIALDGNYAKAVSRRATLHEMIRDYGQAASDLQRLISILERQSSDNAKDNGSSGRSTGSVKDLRQAQMHLPKIEEEAKNGISLDFYLILGSKPTDTSSDIKKAYRKAALKHHPDKAGQFLARSDSGDEGRLWKEISQEVHKDADQLFKMIGEAYAILSDPDKRSQYDLDEESRKVQKERSNASSNHGRQSDACHSGSSGFRRSDFQSSPFERRSYRRNHGDNWKTYGNSYSRW